ncbi:MAG: PA4642 family protein [Pseudomonadales bacterium]
MAIKKDKEKVIDPVWDEARIREFLDLQPPAGENADFHKLLKAYQSMRAEDFDDFVRFFVAAGGSIDARNAAGETVADLLKTHRYSGPYLESLHKHG